MERKTYTASFFKVLTAIHDVEDKLKKPVSEKICGRLFTRLADVQKECKDAELLSKIIFLYGKIIDRYVDTEVREIAQLAKKTSSNKETIAKKIANIKLYGLSRENFSILRDIEQDIKAEAVPTTNIPESFLQDLIQIEELFSLAGLIFSKESEKAKLLHENFPDPIRTSISLHLENLNSPHFEDDLSMIRAIFATAHELSERPLLSYPTSEEIRRFFSEEPGCKIPKAD